MKSNEELACEFSKWIAESADNCPAVVLYDESWISYEMHSRELFRIWAFTTHLPRSSWDNVFKFYMRHYMECDE